MMPTLKLGKVFDRAGCLFLDNFPRALQENEGEPMTSCGAHWNDMQTTRDNGHSDRVIKKCERIAGLKALLKEWELSDNPDLDYVRGLRARLLSVKNQLKNMCGNDGSDGMDESS
jgi:hypothetical protein